MIEHISSTSHRNPLDDALEKLVHSAMDRFHVPGMAVAVIVDDDVYSQGYGMAVLPDKPATAQTLWAAGSTTKSFTTAALSLLIDDKVVDLDWRTPISSVLPEDFVLQDEYASAHVTLEDASCHRTNLPRHEECYGDADKTSKDIVRRLRHLPPMDSPFRTKWEYCNTPWVALSLIVEKVGGMPMEDFLRKRIWTPLGMDRTFFSHAGLEQAAKDGLNIARGYYWDEEQSKFFQEPHMNLSIVAGAGANISSVEDYAKYLKMYMRKSGPLSKEAHDELRKPRAVVPPDDELDPPVFAGAELYALGWEIKIYRGVEVIHHTGGLLGFNALMAYVPSISFGAVLFANASPGGFYAEEAVFYSMLDEKLGVPTAERFDFTAHSLRKLAKAKDAVQATRDKLFPSLLTAVNHSLPLEDYKGTYFSAAYQTLTFTLSQQSPRTPGADTARTVLRAECFQKAWPHVIELEHINGEHFIAWVLSPKATKSPGNGMGSEGFEVVNRGVKAEFKIGPGGKVTKLGIAIEPALGERKMWWKRKG